MDEPLTPITVTITIDTPQGSMQITKVQQFMRRPNSLPGRGKPIQKLSDVYKAAIADANPWVRRNDTVTG